MIYTDALIRELVSCEKIITEAPKVINASRKGFSKKSFLLVSTDGAHHFYGFLTQNNFFAENFSIGLAYNPRDTKGVVVLARVNGMHGGTDVHPHHAVPHIHWATAERINAGLKPEGHIEESDKYTTLEDAIQFYVDLIGLSTGDKRRYFPPPDNQMMLFQ